MLDDDETDAILARRCFRESGVDADFVWFDKPAHLFSHLESLTFTGSPKPLAILLDLNLFAMNGFQVLQIVRSMPAYSHEPPIIVLTHSSQEQDRERAVSLGANGFMTKPVSIETYVDFFKEKFA